jgi:lipopolysaccharide export system protein LptA
MMPLARMTLKPPSRRFAPARLAVWLAAGGLAVSALGGMAQQATFGKGRNFKVVPEFYPAPNAQQMKSLLEGAEAEPLPEGKILVRQAKLRTFKVTGETELQVATPECVYNSTRREIGSAGAIKAQSGDGRFTLEGRNWLWRQTSSSLAISNDVRTVLLAESLANPATQVPASNPGGAPREVNILANRFFYSADEGEGIFGGNVSVAGTNLSLTSESLRFQLPMAAREVKSIVAEQNVRVDYSGVQATGQRAVYSAETGLATIDGDPAWSASQGEGHARELLIDYTNRVFRAVGDAIVTLPGRSLGAGGFLKPGAAGPAAPESPTNHIVEIRSDFYELRTNLAVFGDAVRVRDLVGDSIQGTMDSRSLVVAFAGTNELQYLVAEDNVVIAQADSRFTGGKAFYAATNGVLLITREPAWQSGPRAGKGEAITVDLAREMVEVAGNASMRMPADDLANSSLPGQRQSAGTGKFAEIFSQQYRVDRRQARFVGGVYVTHPQMAWACQELTVNLPAEGARIETILAEQSVTFDLVDELGRKVKGRGERAVYRYSVVSGITNNLLELSGNPVLETTNGTFYSQVIMLDLANNRLIAPAAYRIRGSIPGGRTNALELPKLPNPTGSRRRSN